jgi:ATP-binding cassette, subfamily B, bacterial PglK
MMKKSKVNLTRKNIKRLLLQIDSKKKVQLSMLFILMALSSVAELISIGALVPFLAALVSPDELYKYSFVQSFLQDFKLNSKYDLQFLLTLIFVILALLSAIIRVLLLWSQTRIGHSIGIDLSVKIFNNSLRQPYIVHANTNSNEIISAISIRINDVVYLTIMPILVLLNSIIMFTLMMLVLLATNPLFGLIFVIIGGGYLVILLTLKNHIKKNSQIINLQSTKLIKVVSEGLGNIKDVILSSLQSVYVDKYKKIDCSLRRSRANNQIISNAPRYLIEGLVIAIMAIAAYTLVDEKNEFINYIPVIGAIALGAQKILPVLQSIYSSITSIKSGSKILNDILRIIERDIDYTADLKEGKKLDFKKYIQLKDIWFQYESNNKWVLKNINLKLIKGSKIGITGSSGSGKSTLLNILMGLLNPAKGVLSIDSVNVTKSNIGKYQNLISHVPQEVTLIDESVIENIAFGFSKKEVDIDRVKKVAKMARISEYIEALELGYATIVGEQGVKFSGGQRQRLGLARALYEKSEIIIFDEATSALDSETEERVMESIYSISPEITIIIVAHRLSTLKKCDIIIDLNKGEVFNK